MKFFSANVLVDILLLCFVSVGIALPLYRYIRQVHPELAWNYHGNVRTSSFDKLDLLGIFIASLIFTLSVVQFGSNPNIDTSKLNSISNIQLFMLGLFSQAIPVGIACAFLFPRMDVLEIFGLRRPQVRKVIITSVVGLMGIYLCVAIASALITPLLENNLGKQELQAPVQMIIDAKHNNPALLVYLAILTVIVAPICEEFVFRGYIYGTLKRFSCRFFAATVSALFFAVVHTSLWSLAPLFIIGFCLAIIYEISGSLWASILTHAMFNGVTTCYLIFFYNEANLPY
ncbi:MAG: membrane protease YdiL (CAAX protease family) [Cryomorphaceae bacterium]|jgi:membrane protease YdiL (CAAX protease family)